MKCMNNKEVGKFIKELRKERGMTQYELGSMISVPRASVSKWERGVMGITSDNLILLSEIFDVTVDELIDGKRRKKSLTDKFNETTLKLVDNNTKLHRTIKYTIGIIIILVFAFLIYYFYTFYKSVKIYTVHLDSDKYVANYGLLTKTRDKIYFYLDIDYLIDDIDEIESVQLFYIKGNNLRSIMEISNIQPFSFTAFNGYDEYIKFDEFEDALKRMYIYVNFKDGDFERVQLRFDRDYLNSKILPKRNRDINSDTTTTYHRKESTKFYERFNKLKEVIEKHGKDNTLDFKFEGKMYHLEVFDNRLTISFMRDNKKHNFKYSYYNKEEFFFNIIEEDDEKQVYSFDVQMGKCLKGKCTNHMDNYREMLRLYYEIMYEY